VSSMGLHSWRFGLAASLLFLLACRKPTAGEEKGTKVVQIKFVRSGGMAGRATRVAGAVTFNADGAIVTSDDGKYHRNLPSPEAEQLRSAAAAAVEVGKTANEPSPVRDAFSYLVTIVTEHGKTHQITLDNSAGPKASGLSDWVQLETQKIWEHRISKS
jgi:hypothetical protein